jgi:hypothetical protein
MNQQISDEELDRRVLFEMGFHIGEENAINRWELVEKVFKTHVPEHERNDDNLLDRAVRYAVGRLRKKHHLIGDMGNGAGRYVVKTEHEFWRFYGSYVKPIKERAEIARALKDAAKEKFPNLMQPSLFDTVEMMT